MAIKLTAIKIAIIWSSTTERKKWRYCMQLKAITNERLLYCNDRTPTNRKNSSTLRVRQRHPIRIYICSKKEWSPALRTISTCHSGNAWHSYLWRNQRVRTALWTADATFPKGKFHINHWRISRISLCQSVYRQWHTTYLGPISRDFQNQFHCMRFRLFTMKRIFEDRKEPLYGRLTARISLHPFTTTVIKEILADHAPNSHRKICFACICWQVE